MEKEHLFPDAKAPVTKYFICLNAPRSGEPLFVAYTTSQFHHWEPIQNFCVGDRGVYVLPARHTCFPARTIVLFNDDSHALLLHTDALNTKIDAGEISYYNSIPSHNMNGIVNCIKRNNTFLLDYFYQLL
jgi:hypothetical protein